jgi:O-antigen/teichoic acid export membrane protein
VIRLSLIGAAVGAVLLPRVTAEMARGAADQAARLTRVSTRLLAATMLVVLVPLLAVVPELLRFWIDAEFAARSSLAARILMVAVFANVAARPPLAVIQGRAHPLTLAWVYAGELALHFPLTLLLVARWGITGAALAWSLRVLLDTAVLRALAARTLGRGVGEGGVVWLSTAALAGLVVALSVTEIPVLARGSAGLALTAAAFFALLDREQRGQLVASVAVRARGAAPAAARERLGVPDPEEPEATL